MKVIMLNFFKKNLTEKQIKQMDKAIEKFKKNPHQFRFTVIFFLTSIVFGLLSIYLLQQKFALLMQKNGKVEIKEVIKNVPVPAKDVLEPTQEATESAAVDNDTPQTDWSLVKNEDCNVLIPLSPYQLITDDSEPQKWQSHSFSKGDEVPSAFLNIFDQMEIVGFSNTDETNESGRMGVYCTNNTDGQSVEELKNKIDNELKTNEDLKEISIISSLEKKLWQKDGLEITFSGSNLDGQVFYAIATDKHFYLINKQAETDNETVKKDLERMFGGLIFLD